MRLFIAYKIPEEFTLFLKDLQKQIAECGKFSFTKEFHLTFKFFGEVNPDKIDLIKEKLSGIKFDRFETNFIKLGAFYSKDNVRVIWIGVSNEDKIIKIQKEIDEKLSEVGFEKDNRFSSHITLARVKYVQDKKKLNEIFNKKINLGSFEINKLTLFNSMPTKEGYKHEALVYFFSS